MTAPGTPRPKSPTGRHDPAAPAQRPDDVPAVGAEKDAAEGVVVALRLDPHPAAGPQPMGWLRITAPGRGAVPTAHSWCACGRDRSAVGHRKVPALVEEHTAHRTACPLLVGRTEETAA
ncbi:hypothetical protein RM572_16170 [Streptomyces sp. DSM 42041]|uniref:Uncharacterized protein n=1 Tax=Streptomyces hazeniae TaxID=3075538 RepID=A0ABU2NU92_9ACTN|nr:hypothetical protein [Streptomyces sp. DSM 42041]MDT0380290.1 hypothetical protein [Streptomyces sp. DSM 42041]